MTEVQAAEVIGIVMSDQRLNVLREALVVIDDERRAVHDTEVDGGEATIKLELLDGLEVRIQALMKRGG